MIQIIVFSYNRAMQLDTLLYSLYEHWKYPRIVVDVVYNFSNEEFDTAYDLLKKKYSDKKIGFHRENRLNPDRTKLKDLFHLYNLVRLYKDKKLRHPKTDFRSIVIKLIEQSKSTDVMFLTDDSMFISDIKIDDTILDWINEKPQDRQFSLRLGKGHGALPARVSEKGNLCEWNMYENEGDWGYPFSVDAHIYNSRYLLKLLKTYLFYNPSYLEGNICGVVRRKKNFSEGRCFTDIKMLTFPINIVQSSVDNDSLNVSVEILNQRFLKGESLEYVLNESFDSKKQYVKMIKFTDANGNSYIEEISQDMVRPNLK